MADYAGQHEGTNAFGVNYIRGQNIDTCIQWEPQEQGPPPENTVVSSVEGYAEILAQLGFASVEEMMLAAGL